jgi:hypothetical protein
MVPCLADVNSALLYPARLGDAYRVLHCMVRRCAYDRAEFAKGGWGRLSIGLYSLHLLRWLEHFPVSQFLVLRLEDFSAGNQAYMQSVFDFLEIGQPADWKRVLTERHANENHLIREPILPATLSLLNAFHRPYNELLVQIIEYMLNTTGQEVQSSRKFLWEYVDDVAGHAITLRGFQQQQQQRLESMVRDSDHRAPDHNGRDVFNRHDPHVVAASNRHDLLVAAAEHPLDALEAVAGSILKGSKRLRGSSSSGSVHEAAIEERVAFHPQAFDISALPLATENMTSLFSNSNEKTYHSYRAASKALCAAAFALDIAQLKYLLYTVGVPGNVSYAADFQHNAYHCLALVHTMTEAHAHSHIFAELKGASTYLTSHLKPPLDIQLHSVSSRVILERLEEDILSAAKWLQAAQVPFDAVDTNGNTPLMLAAYGGLTGLVKHLIGQYAMQQEQQNRSTLDAVDTNYRRTALHYAASQGHAKICGLLIAAGSALHQQDIYHVTAYEIIANPGPISAPDARKYMNITQRVARTIERINHPEWIPNNTAGAGWIHGSGGWSTDRLAGYEEDIACEGVDMFHAHELTGQDIFQQYLAHNAPVLIRGLLDHWPAAAHYRAEALKAERGALGVQVSDIPYAKKFGGEAAQDMTLGEYIDRMFSHDLPGGAHPWYVFKGHPVPSMSDESPNSLVPYEQCPTPRSLQLAFELAKVLPWETSSNASDALDKEERRLFINAQWALGAEGTGAPVGLSWMHACMHFAADDTWLMLDDMMM